MKPTRNFASDNNAGVHPNVLKAIAAANSGHAVAYGDDPYTERAKARFHEIFGERIEVFFVYGGTGANVLGLKSVTQPFNAVICADTAHINTDECGAPEHFTGCKLLAVHSDDGKLTTGRIAPLLHGIGVEHHVQPKVISISQVTEMGTVYTLQEIRRISRFAHRNNLLLHMDGARIANAAAALGASLGEMTAGCGVDILSFGGTKNGMMYGEAVVFFDPRLARNFKFIRKQGMQLASKMRFIATQFEALLTGDLWLKSASHANRMAAMLAAELETIPGVRLTQKVEANGVFATMPREWITAIQERYFFYVWNEETSEVRLMTSFDTTEKDIREFAAFVRHAIKKSELPADRDT